MKRHVFLLLAVLFALSLPARADEPRPFPHPDRIHYDAYCLTIDGKDTFIYSGAFHYFRCPKELWRGRFQKFKEAGFNTVETYTAWNWHEREMPKSPDDFSKITGLQDLDDWLTMAEQFGFYIIIRPGPYICAEWDNGGFPSWLLLKKPAQPLRKEAWLRSDDPVFLAWSKHWYDAVCPIIAKHQITRKAAGQHGVILFQIENEYDAFKMAADAKVNQLCADVQYVQSDGIDVPLFTCWTSQSHGVKSGPLRALFDCTNIYVGWNIEKKAEPMITKLRAAQPDAMQATTELQGGWLATVGGKLSEKQDGLTPAQIQNLTLFAWQMGDTLTNCYMLFGGTNFDDWAGRNLITSYDYNAPIREGGGVGERYQRVKALGQMIGEHGPKLTRAEAVELEASAADKDVQIAERRAQDGSRYFFVRTENRKEPRKGTAHVKEKGGAEFSFDYQLEPFGSLVLCLPPGAQDAKQGQWLPKPAPEIERPTDLPAPVVIREAGVRAEPIPSSSKDWAQLEPGEPFESRGIYGSHFLYYKIAAKPGATVTLEVQPGDAVIAQADGKLLPSTMDKGKKHFVFTLPPDAKELVALYENLGHPNFGDKIGQPDGILSVQGGLENALLQFASGKAFHGDRSYGEKISNPNNAFDSSQWKTVALDKSISNDALLTWYRMKLELPEPKAGMWVPWHLHLEAKGNGFIYLNGHCIGRYWQAGPQHDFFLPECWLNFGQGKTNVLALCLRPVDGRAGVQAAAVAPDANFAEWSKNE